MLKQSSLSQTNQKFHLTIYKRSNQYFFEFQQVELCQVLADITNNLSLYTIFDRILPQQMFYQTQCMSLIIQLKSLQYQLPMISKQSPTLIITLIAIILVEIAIITSLNSPYLKIYSLAVISVLVLVLTYFINQYNMASQKIPNRICRIQLNLQQYKKFTRQLRISKTSELLASDQFRKFKTQRETKFVKNKTEQQNQLQDEILKEIMSKQSQIFD